MPDVNVNEALDSVTEVEVEDTTASYKITDVPTDADYAKPVKAVGYDLSPLASRYANRFDAW